MDLEELMKTCRTCAVLASEGSSAIRLHIKPGENSIMGKVVMSASANEMGDNVGEVYGMVTGPEAHIALNSKYLDQVLGALHSKSVTLEVTSPSAPGVIRAVGDDNYIHVVMPMFVQR